MAMAFSKREAKGEARRIWETRRGGSALVIGASALHKQMGKTGFNSTCSPDYKSLPDRQFDIIAMPYPSIASKELPIALTTVMKHLRLGGFFRILLINRAFSEMTDETKAGTPVLDKSELIHALTEAGFKSVVLDHRLFWRDAKIMAGHKGVSWLYTLRAWLKSKRAQGGILAATAWK